MPAKRPECELPPDLVKHDISTSSAQRLGYHISKFNIPEIWATTKGEGVTVAILDTGCDTKHKDLKNSFGAKHNFSGDSSIKNLLKTRSRYKSSISTLKKRIRRTKSKGAKKRMRKSIRLNQRRISAVNKKIKKIRTKIYDGDGHGTHCTGIVTANNNSIGVVGVAPDAKIITIKVLDNNGCGRYVDIATGIDYALAKGADVISMSLGGPDNNKAMRAAVQRAYSKNVPVICAAGNAGNIGKLDYPARLKETISIGAVSKDMSRASFSQTGPNLDFVAPGVKVLSTLPKNRYGVMSGTSMATPWVAGVVALMIAKHRKLGGATPVDTVEEIREHLRKTAIDLSSAGKDKKTGYGLVDVKKLMEENGV